MFKFKSSLLNITAWITGIFFLLCAGTGLAQSIDQPPIVASVDGNGVNLATGKFVMPGLDVGIGGAGGGLVRVTNENGDNFAATVVTDFIPTQFIGGVAYGNYYLNVSFQGAVYRFKVSDFSSNTSPIMITGPYFQFGSAAQINSISPRGDCVGSSPGKCGMASNAAETSSTLACSTYTSAILQKNKTCTLTLTDGTVVNYDQGFVTSATMPDGEVLSYAYYSDFIGPRAINIVSSTLAWALKYEVDAVYKVTKVSAINTSLNECTVSSCTPAAGYPVVALTTVGSTNTIARNGVNQVSYSTSGNVTTLTSPTGVTKTVTTYTSGTFMGRVSSVQYGGSTWNYAYSGAGTAADIVTTVTDPNNITNTLAVSATKKITYTIDGAGRKTSYSYDADGRLIKVINPDGDANTGGFSSYEYDTDGRQTKAMIVPKGGASGGTPIAGAAIVTSATYATCIAGNGKYCKKPLTTTDANGVVTTYTYEPLNGEVKTVRVPAVSGVIAETRYDYATKIPYVKVGGALIAQAPVYRPIAVSSCMTASTNACVNGVDEQRTTIAYNSTNAPVAGTPYSNNLQPLSSTVGLGNGTLQQQTSSTYNAYGAVIVTDGPKPGADDEAYVFYDALGRVEGSIGSDPDLTNTTQKRWASHTYYNSDGQVNKVETGLVSGSAYSGTTPEARHASAKTDLAAMVEKFVTTTEFSTSTGLPIISRAYTGNMTTLTSVGQQNYDNLFRVKCAAQRLNSATWGSVGTMDACVPGAAASDGTKDRVTSYVYEGKLGFLISTISGVGTTAQQTEFTNTYDIATTTSSGVLLSVKDGKGNETAYAYDAFNRPLKTCYPTALTANGGSGNPANTSPTTGDCESVIYRTTALTGATQAGTLVNTVTTRANSTDATTMTFSYDARGRVSSKTGTGVNESVAYNNYSLVTSHANTTTGHGFTSTYAYNALGWLSSDTQTMSTAPTVTVGYEYDAYGRKSKLIYPTATTNLYVTYAYNNANAVTKICENVANCLTGTALVTYVYDDMSNNLTINRANSVPTTAVLDTTYNRLSTLTQGPTSAAFKNVATFGYNPAYQITSKANSNASYDMAAPSVASNYYASNGLNQYAKAGPATLTYDARGNMTSNGTTTFTYNVNNLLISASTGGGFALRYDAEGRLALIDSTATAARQFVYDGADLIAEYNSSGTVQRRYVHGPGADEPIVWYEGSDLSTRRFYNADENNSVVLVTDNAGAQVAINTYDAYGKPGSSNQGAFQYTGQIWLPEIGLYYYKARMYNATLGRFMQTDPIGYGDGMNWYAYVGNDPVNSGDSLGLCDPRGGFCGEGDGGDCSSVWGCPGAPNWFGTYTENYNYALAGVAFFDEYAPGYQNGLSYLAASKSFAEAEGTYSPEFILGTDGITLAGGLAGAKPGVRGTALGRTVLGIVADSMAESAQYRRKGYIQVWRLFTDPKNMRSLYGGPSCNGGSCWSTDNMALMASYHKENARNLYAIYPQWNTLDYQAHGWVSPNFIIHSFPAQALGPYTGGGNETSIRNAQQNVVGVTYTKIGWWPW